MPSLLQLFADIDRAGVYQTDLDSAEIAAAARTAGLEVFRINLSSARGKSDLLDRIAKSLRFPPHFGNNWDALNDCLSDLEWLNQKGWLLIIGGATKFNSAHEEDFRAAIDVFASVAAHWRERQQPFWVLIQGSEELSAGLPRLVTD